MSGNANMNQDKVSVREEAGQLLDMISISEMNVKSHKQIVSTSGNFQEVYVVND